MRKTPHLALVILGCLLALPAPAAVLRVPQDLPGIQAAMDASAPGDTVRVDRGVWTGLLTSPVHSLTLCSNYPFTGDSTDIVETVLDGQYAGTILDVVCGTGERFALQGLTLCHGQGTRVDIFDFCDRAGALQIANEPSMSVHDVVFRDNRAPHMASVLFQGTTCLPDARGDLELVNVHCRNNSITDPQGELTGSIAVRISFANLLIRNLVYEHDSIDTTPIYINANAMTSILVDSVRVVDCSFDWMTMSLRVNGSNDFLVSNVSITNPTIGKGGVLQIQCRITEVADPLAVFRNITMTDCEVDESWLLYLIDGSGGTQIDYDGITFARNRTQSPGNPDAPSRGIRLWANNHGTARNLHLHHNILGDSTDHRTANLLYLEGVDLVDSHIHDNRIIIAPDPNPASTGGNFVRGAMVYRRSGPALFENLVFENNVVEDLDNYSSHSPSLAYYVNEGRELYVDGITAVLRNILVRNSRHPNPCPETYGAVTMGSTGPSSAIMLVTGHSLVETLRLEDVDDGGMSLRGPMHYLDNVVLKQVGRTAFYAECSVALRLRNVHVEDVDAWGNFLSPSRRYLSDQAFLSLYSSIGYIPVVDMENVTITGCDDMRHLFRFNRASTMNVRNSIIWNNAYSQLIQATDPVTLSWDHSLIQENVPGWGNLIGVDPLFDEELGAPFLSPLSPCIDAGDVAWAWEDLEDPERPGFALWPSQGGLRNDMGYTGGPHASLLPDTLWAAMPTWEPRLIPQIFSLGAPWPNPFNPATQIPFTLLRPMPLRLSVHNLLGQEVAVLMNGVLPAGTHQVAFRPGKLASGLYLVTLEAAGRAETRTVALLR